MASYISIWLSFGTTSNWTHESLWSRVQTTPHCKNKCVIGPSLSEPHTSESNSGFFIYYILYIIIYLPYVRRSINADWALLTRNIVHADPCGQKIENNAVPITSATPTDWVKLPNQRRSKKRPETSDQRSKRLRNWGWGTVPDALLKLLVKDKPLYSGKVRERRETKPPRREERG